MSCAPWSIASALGQRPAPIPLVVAATADATVYKLGRPGLDDEQPCDRGDASSAQSSEPRLSGPPLRPGAATPPLMPLGRFLPERRSRKLPEAEEESVETRIASHQKQSATTATDTWPARSLRGLRHSGRGSGQGAPEHVPLTEPESPKGILRSLLGQATASGTPGMRQAVLTAEEKERNLVSRFSAAFLDAVAQGSTTWATALCKEVCHEGCVLVTTDGQKWGPGRAMVAKRLNLAVEQIVGAAKQAGVGPMSADAVRQRLVAGDPCHVGPGRWEVHYRMSVGLKSWVLVDSIKVTGGVIVKIKRTRG